MADRDEVLAYCDSLLDVQAFGDYCPNGMQVPGRRAVSRIVTGVSAHLELLEQAAALGADLVLAHHGLLWDFHPRALSEQMAARLRVALEAGFTVAGYHLPLDAHPAIGNNVLLARALGFEPASPEPQRLGTVKGREIGIVATHPAGVEAAELWQRVEAELGRRPLVQGNGPGLVRNLGVVTGSAAGEIHEAIGLGLDAFLTGEPAEHAKADAEEGAIHFAAAGHYATETFGIRRLGELLAESFGLDHTFIDVPNPV